MAGKINRLVTDPLHQAAVAGDHIGVVIDEVIAETRIQHAFAESHTHGGCDSLTERTGGRFDASGMAEFRMPGSATTELTKTAQLIHRHVVEAEEVMKRVQQHRSMPSAQHKAIAIRPIGLRRVDLDEVLEEHRSHIRHAHGHSGMARLRSLDRVHRERADRVRHLRLI